jgi:hypothetical protein
MPETAICRDRGFVAQSQPGPHASVWEVGGDLRDHERYAA